VASLSPETEEVAAIPLAASGGQRIGKPKK